MPVIPARIEEGIEALEDGLKLRSFEDQGWKQGIEETLYLQKVAEIISRAWWHMTEVPATQEAEVRRLAWE